MKLILLRHGESEWNLANKFTGWTDVALTPTGILEANFSGKQLLKKNDSEKTFEMKDLFRKLTDQIIETLRINGAP